MIQPASLEELASLVEKRARRSFFLWQTGVAIVVISILLYQKLRTNPEFTFIQVDRDQYHGFSQTLGCLRDS